MKRRTSQGFTLVELMITVAILGVLIALSTAALQGLRSRADLAAAASEMSSAFQTMRHHARAQNTDVWFGVRIPDATLQGEGISYMVIEDPTSDFDPEGLGNNWPDPQTDLVGYRIQSKGQFSEEIVPVPVSDIGDWGEAPDELRPPDAALDDGCSFCNFDAGQHSVGWILALPRGEIRVLEAPDPDRTVEGLILSSAARDATADWPRMVVFTIPFGVTETFRLDP